MKKTLLLAFSFSVAATLQAQKQSTAAYAITSAEKGSSRWTEVRLVDLATGQELKSIYQSANDAEVFNARTGKAIAKQEGDAKKTAATRPFATASAACAYDKKNNRLYYTPMGINQLRYVDLKAKTPKVYFFEDEAFGVVKGPGDVGAQITRMVIGGDGNGYALSNDANHLVRFTAKKKPEIKDLGALTEDPTNGRYSIHSSGNYGGDMIADKKGNLYLVTSNNSVFIINISSKQASYVGRIKGLPRGYSTNGAIAEGNSNVFVSSSKSTNGYYKFDLNTLKAEKISSAAAVFNASDLANGAFAFEKSEEKPAGELAVVEGPSLMKAPASIAVRKLVSVYPNPVTAGFFKLTFTDQQPGRYNVQLLDVAGKVISTKLYTLNSKLQVEEFKLPQQLAAGNYLVRVMAENNSKEPVVQQLVVQQ